MKKVLLFMGLVSFSLLHKAQAQTLTYDALPNNVELGSTASFTLHYTSTVEAKIGVALFIFSDDNGDGILTQDWNTWQAGTSTAVLPVTATESTQTVTLAIPGGIVPSSQLAAGKLYVWALSLNTAADAWITGTQVATTLIASANVASAIAFTGTPVAQVNAGDTAMVGYSYTLAESGIVKIALSHYSSDDKFIDDVVNYIINPADATTTTPVTGTASLAIPATAVTSAALPNGEKYMWEIGVYDANWGYKAGNKSNVTVNAVAGLADNRRAVLSVYPNPASDMLFIAGVDVQKAQLFDVTGKMLLAVSVANAIDVSPLAPGIYFIKVNDAKALKFIKK